MPSKRCRDNDSTSQNERGRETPRQSDRATERGTTLTTGRTCSSASALDLTGCSSRLALSAAIAAAKQPLKTTKVQCGFFPRGSMELLLSAVPNVESFACQYSRVRAHNISNPDLKLLFKTRGSSLRELMLTPA